MMKSNLITLAKGYTAHITDVTTGETRVKYFDDCNYTVAKDDPKQESFWWTEGNASCGCNRGMWFAVAGGGDPDFDYPCEENWRYKVKLIAKDGTVLYDENKTTSEAS